MPKVPTTSPTIGMDVPGVSVDTRPAGDANAALARVGAQMTEIGFSLANQIKQQEAKEAIFQQENSDYLASQEYTAKLKKLYSDGYVRDDAAKIVSDPVTGTYRTITDEYKDWSEKRYQSAQDAMPSEFARQLYSQSQSKWFTGKRAEVFSEQQGMQMKAFEAQTSMSVQHVSDSFMATPSHDLKEFYQQGDRLSQYIQSGVGVKYGKVEADEIQRQALSKISNSNIEGMILNILDRSRSKDASFNSKMAAVQVLRILDDREDQAPGRKQNGAYTAANVLTPEQQKTLRRELLSIINTTAKLDETNYNEFLKDLNAKARGRRIDIGQGFGLIQQNSQPFLMSGQLSSESVARQKAMFAAERVLGDADTRGFRLLTREGMLSQEKKLLPILDEHIRVAVPPDSPYASTVGEYARKHLHDELVSAADKYEAQNRSDPARYAVMNDPHGLGKLQNSINWDDIRTWASSGFFNYLDKVERDVRSKNPGYDVDERQMPKDIADRMARTIKSPDTPASLKAEVLTGMAKAEPEKYYKTMRQMISDGALGYEWEYITRMPDQRLATEIITTFTKGYAEDEQKNFDAFLKGKGSSIEQFRETIRPEINAFVSSVKQRSPWDPNQSKMERVLREFFERKAAEIMRGPGTGNAREAGKDAYQALVGNTTEVYSLRGDNGVGTDISLPKSIRTNSSLPKSPQNEMPLFRSDDRVLHYWWNESMNAEGIAKLKPVKPKNWPEGIDEKRIAEQIAKNGYPQQDPRQPETIVFYFKGQWDRAPQPLIVQTKNGPQIYRIPLSEILKLREASKGTMDKVKEFFFGGDK